MSNPHSLATGALSQNGLPNVEQRELLLQKARDPERTPLSHVPVAPTEYIARAKDSLPSIFLSQYGPLQIPQPNGQRGIVSRSVAWDLIAKELASNSLHPTWNRPICGIHDVLIEVITAMAKNEFPLSAPPRWASGLLSVLGHAVSSKMKSANLSTALPTLLDADYQTYVESVLTNLGNDEIRSSRQRSNFRANVEELVLGPEDNLLLRPEPDCVVPLLPAGLALRRPRLLL